MKYGWARCITAVFLEASITTAQADEGKGYRAVSTFNYISG